MRRASLIIRTVYAACLTAAALNHALILMRHGLLWDYGGVAWPSAVYWTSLTFLDTLVVYLLFARPRLGVIATAVLIGTNVLHNMAILAQRTSDGAFVSTLLSSPMVLSQIAFMLFVGATARIAIKGAPSPRSDRR